MTKCSVCGAEENGEEKEFYLCPKCLQKAMLDSVRASRPNPKASAWKPVYAVNKDNKED